MRIPSSNPFATPEKLHTAVQKKSQTLNISRGHALMALTVSLRRLDLVIVSTIKPSSVGQHERERKTHSLNLDCLSIPCEGTTALLLAEIIYESLASKPRHEDVCMLGRFVRRPRIRHGSRCWVFHPPKRPKQVASWLHCIRTRNLLTRRVARMSETGTWVL